jgi:hypothetical protein
MTWTKRLLPIAIIAAAAFGGGCEEKPQLAPEAADLKPSAPKAAEAVTFAVDKASSKVEFMMEAPQEKIRGRVTGAATGELQVDVMDLMKTTGLITVDISGIELFQTIAGEDGKFGEEKKSDLQNEHARTWLQISKDAPPEELEKNAKTQFAIRKIESVSEANVTKMTGAERKVTLKATGDLLLHQRKSEMTVELEAIFKFQGDKPQSVAIKTAKPFGVSLAAHDVHPRESFGKLAQKTLDLLAPKVAKEALVSIELTAALAPGGAAPAKDAPAKDAPMK